MKKLIVAISVLIFASTSFAGGLLDNLHQPGIRTTTVFNEVCYAPYIVESAGFCTGINIMPDKRFGSVQFLVGFYDSEIVYGMNELTIGPAGWTGMATALLPPGVPFRSPSMLVLVSLGSDNGRFWVTKFVFTGAGFSHIVLPSASIYY